MGLAMPGHLDDTEDLGDEEGKEEALDLEEDESKYPGGVSHGPAASRPSVDASVGASVSASVGASAGRAAAARSAEAASASRGLGTVPHGMSARSAEGKGPPTEDARIQGSEAMDSQSDNEDDDSEDDESRSRGPGTTGEADNEQEEEEKSRPDSETYVITDRDTEVTAEYYEEGSHTLWPLRYTQVAVLLEVRPRTGYRAGSQNLGARAPFSFLLQGRGETGKTLLLLHYRRHCLVAGYKVLWLAGRTTQRRELPFAHTLETLLDYADPMPLQERLRIGGIDAFYNYFLAPTSVTPWRQAALDRLRSANVLIVDDGHLIPKHAFYLFDKLLLMLRKDLPGGGAVFGGLVVAMAINPTGCSLSLGDQIYKLPDWNQVFMRGAEQRNAAAAADAAAIKAREAKRAGLSAGVDGPLSASGRPPLVASVPSGDAVAASSWYFQLPVRNALVIRTVAHTLDFLANFFELQLPVGWTVAQRRARLVEKRSHQAVLLSMLEHESSTVERGRVDTPGLRPSTAEAKENKAAGIADGAASRMGQARYCKRNAKNLQELFDFLSLPEEVNGTDAKGVSKVRTLDFMRQRVTVYPDEPTLLDHAPSHTRHWPTVWVVDNQETARRVAQARLARRPLPEFHLPTMIISEDTKLPREVADGLSASEARGMAPYSLWTTLRSGSPVIFCAQCPGEAWRCGDYGIFEEMHRDGKGAMISLLRYDKRTKTSSERSWLRYYPVAVYPVLWHRDAFQKPATDLASRGAFDTAAIRMAAYPFVSGEAVAIVDLPRCRPPCVVVHLLATRPDHESSGAAGSSGSGTTLIHRGVAAAAADGSSSSSPEPLRILIAKHSRPVSLAAHSGTAQPARFPPGTLASLLRRTLTGGVPTHVALMGTVASICDNLAIPEPWFDTPSVAKSSDAKDSASRSASLSLSQESASPSETLSPGSPVTRPMDPGHYGTALEDADWTDDSPARHAAAGSAAAAAAMGGAYAMGEPYAMGQAYAVPSPSASSRSAPAKSRSSSHRTRTQTTPSSPYGESLAPGDTHASPWS